MIIFVCDKCGEQSEQLDSAIYRIPEDWRELSFQIRYNQQKKVFLCPACCVKLRLDTQGYNETVGDSLIEILTEIAQGVVQQELGN